MRPLADYLLIKPDQIKQTTDSGLYVSEDWKTLPQTGEVLSVGPDVKTVKAGEHVMYMRYATIDGDDGVKIAREMHIIGVYDGPKS